MTDDLHLPWDRASLEALLQKIVSTGETSKIDLKSSFDLSDVPHQAELLKDLSAIANTFNHHYRNHGFLVFGAHQNLLTGCTLPDGEDHLQARVDDLVKRYLGPFITTHLFIFSSAGTQWGVIVVPPTHNTPHVFINDIHKRYRGDVYVRSGTTTVKAQPDDYARFFRQHLEEHTYEVQQNIGDLQRQIALLTAQIKKLKASRPMSGRAKSAKPVETPSELPSEAIDMSRTLTERIDHLFAKEEDFIAKGLLAEARKIQTFLESSEIPWAAQTTDQDKTRELVGKIEAVAAEFWGAIISLVMKDDKGAHDEALLKAISYLARVANPGPGVSFTEWGRSLRYYPLFVALHLISIITVAKKRERLLAKVLKLDLREHSRYDDPLPITYVLFLMRRAGDFFQPLHTGYPGQRWCDPIASYTKPLIDRILNPDDPSWDQEADFFKGEFVLAISPLDVIEKSTKRPMTSYPAAGLYLLLSEAQPIIIRLLKQDKEWLQKLFMRPLAEILRDFDQTATRLANSSGCWASGFQGGALEAAFPEEAKKNQAGSK